MEGLDPLVAAIVNGASPQGEPRPGHCAACGQDIEQHDPAIHIERTKRFHAQVTTMPPTNHSRALSLVAIAGLLATLIIACSDSITCSSGSVCGDGNYVGPSVAASPTPGPSPTASPSPSASPVATCVLPTSSATKCEPVTPALALLVSNAQSTIAAGSSEAAYVAALVAALRKAGVCATSGGALSSDEVAVKTSNSFSETYDVWNGANFPQTLYQSTCTPARF